MGQVMQAGTNDPLELLTLREVAAITKRSRASLYADIRAGRLQTVHLGRSVRVPRSELERYVAEGWEAS
jgi:excisionase family DNA binding protein